MPDYGDGEGVRLPAELSGLDNPAAYPHPVRGIEVLETHISWIVLTGDFSYKIKRPVRFSFLDTMRLERRRELCQEEVRLNRRLAPEIYLEVCPITGTGAEARLGGPGEPVEYAVRMRQFDRGGELDRLVAHNELRPEELVAFGTELAGWHGTLPTLPDAKTFDDPAAIAKLIATNARECATTLADFGHAPRVNAIAHSLSEYVTSRQDALAARARANTFRDCHGDLHLSNLVRLGTRIVAFDCIDFDRRFRCIDVADEIAFLCADLEARQRPDLAQHFLNAYLARSGDFGSCSVLNLYAAHRSVVMAKTTALAGRSNMLDPYLATAEAALRRPRPLSIVMHGLTGSGKTWLASRLAAVLPAVHVRSDVERKRAARLDSTASSNSQIGAGLYDAEHNLQTYERLQSCAREALAGRCNVILDATFLRRTQRAQIRDLAAACDARFVIVRCVAANDTLEIRLNTRAKTAHDASEADAAVMKAQRENMDDLTQEETRSSTQANTADPHVVERVVAAIRAA